MSKITWKAYEEVHFSDQYILRWVRVGDEYVNTMTKETMEDLKSVVRQQQAEIEALKWEVNHREQDVDALKTKLNDVKYKYDIKIHQHVYTQVYVDELQAEIEALKLQNNNYWVMIEILRQKVKAQEK